MNEQKIDDILVDLPKDVQIRVGTRKYLKGGKYIDPTFKGFKPAVVLTKSTRYGSLGPYEIENFENYWQFCKVYPSIPKSIQRYSRWDKRVIWNHPAEIHLRNGCITPELLNWRAKGMNCKDAIRYPVGFSKKARSSCIGSLTDEMLEKMKNDNTGIVDGKLLNYIESRKQVYLPKYCQLVKKKQQYHDLHDMLKRGVNLLIIEVDGPIEASLSYYKEKYGVSDDFIENSTILVTVENMKIMLNDPKHPFGHGFCLGVSLLGIDKEIL